MRALKRAPCSSSVIENQYFKSLVPLRVSIFSNSGTISRTSRIPCSEQNPITRSTPDRLYQERSNSTLSPAAGRCAT